MRLTVLPSSMSIVARGTQRPLRVRSELSSTVWSRYTALFILLPLFQSNGFLPRAGTQELFAAAPVTHGHARPRAWSGTFLPKAVQKSAPLFRATPWSSLQVPELPKIASMLPVGIDFVFMFLRLLMAANGPYPKQRRKQCVHGSSYISRHAACSGS